MAAAELQALLRFLTQEAKIPLVEAMPQISALRKRGLNTPGAIAQANSSMVQEVFNDEKIVKQVMNAAKRTSVSKKRTASETASAQNKRLRTQENAQPHDIEASLALPLTDAAVEELERVELETNRAPLVLAFALVTLEYTMPEQPLSSRLSLAQAVVSANSQSKAKSIGLINGPTAEDEGWARGQPKVKIMNREIAVMRRHIHSLTNCEDSQETVKAEESPTHDAFWGLDLEALRVSNGPLVAGKLAGSLGPPIHTAQAARSYLLRSISVAKLESKANESATSSKKKQSPTEIAKAKEKAVAMLLMSIRLVCDSWASTLSATELDKRAWNWYLAVRPDVAQGQSGWGQRGRVRLADIIKLKRTI